MNGTSPEASRAEPTARADASRSTPPSPVSCGTTSRASPNPARRAPTEALKPGDRLFSGDRGGYLAAVTYRRAWADARTDVLRPHEASSLLGKTPYDLRHTCPTTRLNAGVPAAQVAAWAGNSVRILLTTYINCVDGGDDDLKRRIKDALPD